VFYPELKLGPNTIIQGKIAAEDGEFKLNFRSPRIDVFDYMMDKVSVQIDNKNPLFNTAIQVGKIDAGFYQASEFDLINKTLRDTLFFKTNFRVFKDRRLTLKEIAGLSIKKEIEKIEFY